MLYANINLNLKLRNNCEEVVFKFKNGEEIHFNIKTL